MFLIDMFLITKRCVVGKGFGRELSLIELMLLICDHCCQTLLDLSYLYSARASIFKVRGPNLCYI